MDPEKKVQAEDKPVEKTPVESPKVEVQAPAKKSIVDRALPWVIVFLAAFLAGALVTYFALMQPKVTQLDADLASAQADLTAETEKSADLQRQIDTLNATLTTTQNDLAAAQTTIEEQTAALAKSEQLALIYKFGAGVNAARATLEGLDPASSRQALSFVKQDLAELELTEIDPAALSGFQTKIEEAESNLESNPLTSKAALEALYSNLLLLISNLD